MTWHDARVLLDLAVALVVTVLLSIWAGNAIQWLIDHLGRPSMSGKRYGKPQSTRLPESWPFELYVSLDDEDEVHAFTAVRQVDKLLGARFTGYTPEQAHKQVDLLVRLIHKTLDDKDGTPASWAAVELPRPHDIPDEDFRPKFRGPDGELYEMEHVGKFAAFEAGSSRRRFIALCNDQDRTVQAEDLAEITRDLIAVSAGRPTGASVPSSA